MGGGDVERGLGGCARCRIGLGSSGYTMHLKLEQCMRREERAGLEARRLTDVMSNLTYGALGRW